MAPRRLFSRHALRPIGEHHSDTSPKISGMKKIRYRSQEICYSLAERGRKTPESVAFWRVDAVSNSEEATVSKWGKGTRYGYMSWLKLRFGWPYMEIVSGYLIPVHPEAVG